MTNKIDLSKRAISIITAIEEAAEKGNVTQVTLYAGFLASLVEREVLPLLSEEDDT